MIPILYGTIRFVEEVIWFDKIKKNIKTTSSSSSGKSCGKAETITRE